MIVGLQMVQIHSHLDALHFGECFQVNYRNGVFVVRHHVAARIGHIHLLAHNLNAVGLMPHHAHGHHLQGGSIELGHISFLLIIGGDDHRSCIAGDVCIRAVETDVAAVGNLHLSDAFSRVAVHHLHLVRCIDDGIQPVAVNGQVVAHIAHLLRHARIGIAIDVPCVFACGIVVVIQRGLVAAHVALVQQVEALNVFIFRQEVCPLRLAAIHKHLWCPHLFHFRQKHLYVFATGTKRQQD